ncbi:MAG: hypothetical protein JO182_14560 [Acidobacteriaceae bacterium]|nr:hypothetical protein [Acidobacteriaceae bacterium]MBV9223126.1 hypothetical protein [Acidobacteriaceae bacterium]MBV9308588.1 hypothetical protein [Acidobacteriaceae bacterium]MBV9679361.1 hypothetical protein [Acidobacteriaceae bacterium]
MKFQSELRKSKRVVREWVRAHFSDEKLASVVAFNADGKMSFRNPCSCLMGVTYSDYLHVGHDCHHEHYRLARQQDWLQNGCIAAFLSSSGMGKAERAYLFLGFSANFNDCFGNDEVRRRRFSALLRAEMRRRERLNMFDGDHAVVSVVLPGFSAEIISRPVLLP